MALDPRIPLAVQGPQVEQPDLLKTMLAAGQMREQQQMLGLRDMQAQQLQQTMARQRALADLWQEAQAPAASDTGPITQTPLTPGAPPPALPGMAPRRPSPERMLAVGGAEALPQIEALQRLDAHQLQQQTAARQNQLLKLQQMDKGIDFVSQALTVVHDQRSLDAAVQEVSQASPYLGQMLPQTYDQAAIEALLKRLQLAKQRGQSQQAGLTMHYGRDAAGNVVPLRMTQEGMQQPAMPPGVTLLPPTYSVPGATDTTILQRPGGAPVSSIPKQVGQAAHEKAEGTATGKYAGELPPLARKAGQAMQQLDQKQALAVQDIDRALKVMDSATFPVTGVMSDILAHAYQPGTDFRALLKSVGVQMGFDELQAMRDASPTGGALGQVSDFENRQLQALRGNIEAAQSAAQLRDNLERLKQFLATRQQARQAAYDETFGAVRPRSKTISRAEIQALAAKRSKAEKRTVTEEEVEQAARNSHYEVLP